MQNGVSVMRAILLTLVLAATCHADGMDEVNAWRRRVGLRPFIEDPRLTEFCRRKAIWRAQHLAYDNHAGPRNPAGTTEGTGEAKATWGWLTCAIECDFTHAGAYVVINARGDRVMVFVGRGGSGRDLINPNSIPTFNTSRLTPNPLRVPVQRSR